MEDRPWLPALVGIGVASALLIAGVVAWVVGAIPRGDTSQPPPVLLVAATAPDEEGGLVPVVIFELRRTALGSAGSLVMQSPEASSTVPGTSATTLADAYPFGGGGGLAAAYARLRGAEPLPWVVLGPQDWARIIDGAGGLEVTVPTEMNVYQDGSLVLLESGRQTLRGREALALASGLAYLEDRRDRDALRYAIAEALRSAIASEPASLAAAVETGTARSSIPVEALRRF